MVQDLQSRHALMRKSLVILAVFSAALVAPPLHSQCSIPPGATSFNRLRLARMRRATALNTEREPNDAPSTAMLVSLTDTINATIGTEGDLDYYAIDLDAGTQFDAKVDISGSALYNPTFWLLDRDGVTPLLQHDWQSQEYRLRYTVTTAGRYYLRVANYRPGTGAYVLQVGRYIPPRLGPGDPVTTFWTSENAAIAGLAAGARGDVFVGNDAGVFRLTSAGDSVPFASGIDAEFGVLVDAGGSVLALGCEYPNGSIWRISVDGQRSRFFAGQGTPSAGTIGPDGDVWINDFDSGELWRFDPEGNRKGAIGANWFVSHLGFSPAGDLYFTDRDGLHRVVNNTTQIVVPAPDPNEWFDDFAFDRDGYLYLVLVSPYEGGYNNTVLEYDAQYQPIQNPFAQVGDHFASASFSDIVFARGLDGRMTKRLLVGRMVMLMATQPNHYGSDIVELNPQGIRAPGWPVGGPLIRIADVVRATLGVDDALSSDQKAFLDTQGNHNGVLDIGDLRAYLRSAQP
jgi:hypothetical protein